MTYLHSIYQNKIKTIDTSKHYLKAQYEYFNAIQE